MVTKDRLRLGEPGTEEDLGRVGGDFTPEFKRFLPAEILIGLGFELLEQPGIRRQDMRQIEKRASAGAGRPQDFELPGEILLLALARYDEDRGVLVADTRAAWLDRWSAHQAPLARELRHLLRHV